MQKIAADLFDYVGQRRPDRVLLPMSPYLKKNQTAVMGAGILRRVVDVFPSAPSEIGRAIARSAGGRVSAPVNLGGVDVSAWLIQPAMCSYYDTYTHLRARFDEPYSEDEAEVDIPGWACRPNFNSVHGTLFELQQLRGNIVIAYPHIDAEGSLSHEKFNELMSQLDDRFTLVTRPKDEP